MAQMIPGDITHLSKDTTPGEKALYRIIKKHTPSEWICYVGQRLSQGTTPDFVIIGPDLGIVILEEKNIPINMIKEFTTETWTVIRDGIPQISTHPLRQARGYAEKALGALRKYKRLTDEKGRLKFVVMHGAVLSSITRNELAQGSLYFSTPPITTFEPQLLICSNELPKSNEKETEFEQHLRRMTASLFSFDKLDDGDIQTIRGALYPEVRAKHLSDALIERGAALQALTVQQEQMARGIGKNDAVPHRLIKGVAGCGKSIILKTRALEVARENPKWNILVTFFTRSLRNYLGKDLPANVDVKTIGQVVYDQYKKHYLNKGDFDSQSEDFCTELINYLSQNNISKKNYQAIFVDEIQDINPSQIRLLRHLLDEETNCALFCGDDIQNIFDCKKPSWKELGFNFWGRSSSIDLSSNFRNTLPIIDFAMNFIRHDPSLDNDVDDIIGKSKSSYEEIECKRVGPKPFLRNFSDIDCEYKGIALEIVRLVKSEKVQNKSIAIIHPRAIEKHRVEISVLIRSLAEVAVPIYWLSETQSSKIEYNPEIDKVTLTTPESAKGLEWDIVFMPSINNYYGNKPNFLKFVAATRARDILYPSEVGKDGITSQSI